VPPRPWLKTSQRNGQFTAYAFRFDEHGHRDMEAGENIASDRRIRRTTSRGRVALPSKFSKEVTFSLPGSTPTAPLSMRMVQDGSSGSRGDAERLSTSHRQDTKWMSPAQRIGNHQAIRNRRLGHDRGIPESRPAVVIADNLRRSSPSHAGAPAFKSLQATSASERTVPRPGQFLLPTQTPPSSRKDRDREAMSDSRTTPRNWRFECLETIEDEHNRLPDPTQTPEQFYPRNPMFGDGRVGALLHDPPLQVPPASRSVGLSTRLRRGRPTQRPTDILCIELTPIPSRGTTAVTLPSSGARRLMSA
jgi:hypothetical protein